METASALRINALASPTTRRMADKINLAQTARPSTRQEKFRHIACGRFFYSSPPSHQRSLFPNYRHSLTIRCSTKPGLDSNNATNRNPALKLDSNSTAQHLATPPSNAELTSTYSKGLVFDLGLGNSWDNAEIGSPVVKRFIGDNEERWLMWYHGRSDDDDASDSIGLAVSSNGIHWARESEHVRSCTEAGIVMTCRNNWWAFDTESMTPSEMVIMSSPTYSSVYWLYYTGYSSEELEVPGISNISLENPETVQHESRRDGNYRGGKILKSLPGLACSQDGRQWARIEGDHHSGALFDVGSEKEWDSLFIASPQVVVHSSDDIRMYYYSFDAEHGRFAIGIARSRDGIRWVKLGKILGGGPKGSFDELGVKNACVVRNRKEGNYLMAYEGVSAHGVRRIGIATSPDGLKWKRLQEDPVLGPSEEDGWDNMNVGSPCLIPMEENVDKWRLYYAGVGQEGRTGIGMAVSEGNSIKNFRRWAGFQP